VLFHAVNARDERGHPTLVTTNRGLPGWGEVFGDAVVAGAMLDRAHAPGGGVQHPRPLVANARERSAGRGYADVSMLALALVVVLATVRVDVAGIPAPPNEPAHRQIADHACGPSPARARAPRLAERLARDPADGSTPAQPLD